MSVANSHKLLIRGAVSTMFTAHLWTCSLTLALPLLRKEVTTGIAEKPEFSHKCSTNLICKRNSLKAHSVLGKIIDAVLKNLRFLTV
jgi:hypothetical protein